MINIIEFANVIFSLNLHDQKMDLYVQTVNVKFHNVNKVNNILITMARHVKIIVILKIKLLKF